jgi:2-iminobutanoate/2-iminopropanoate deaminase
MLCAYEESSRSTFSSAAMPTWTPVFLPDEFPLPKGPYSPAVRAGDFLYVSGQTPRDALTGALVANDVATQARLTLSNVKRILYLQEMDDWAIVNEVYKEFFVSPFPSRTAVGCELRDILVEISVVAYLRHTS